MKFLSDIVGEGVGHNASAFADAFGQGLRGEDGEEGLPGPPGASVRRNVFEGLILAADQTIINSATLADTTLTFSALPNRTYAFRLSLLWEATALGDFKWDLNGPASPTLVRAMYVNIPAGGTLSGAASSVLTAFASTVSVAGTLGGSGATTIDGLVQNGSTGGAVTLRFAQATATNDTGAILRKGSWLEFLAM